MTNKSLSQNWNLLTFGGGSFPQRRAAQRLKRVAEDTGAFKKVFAYSDKDLAQKFPDFWIEHQSFIERSDKGFGYWLWKPFLIRETLSIIPDGEGLLYLDAGCHINLDNAASRARFAYYKELADSAGIFAMQLESNAPGEPDLSEKVWSRVALTDLLKLTEPQLSTGQIQAGIQMIVNRPETRAIVSDWFSIATMDDYFFLRDALPDEKNDDSFVAHRHDQAIFSALAKTRNIAVIPDETYWPPDWRTRGSDFPIWAMRNKTGIDPRGISRLDVLDRIYATVTKPLRFVGLLVGAIWRKLQSH